MHDGLKEVQNFQGFNESEIDGSGDIQEDGFMDGDDLELIGDVNQSGAGGRRFA